MALLGQIDCAHHEERDCRVHQGPFKISLDTLFELIRVFFFFGKKKMCVGQLGMKQKLCGFLPAGFLGFFFINIHKPLKITL